MTQAPQKQTPETDAPALTPEQIEEAATQEWDRIIAEREGKSIEAAPGGDDVPAPAPEPAPEPAPAPAPEPSPEPAPAPIAADGDKDDDDGKTGEPAPAPAPSHDELVRAEYESRLRKQDSYIGNLRQSLDAVNKKLDALVNAQNAPAPAPAATPQPTPAPATPKWDYVRSEYEDVAAGVEELMQTNQVPGLTENQVTEIVQRAVHSQDDQPPMTADQVQQSIQDGIADALIEAEHPDWGETVRSVDFKAWFNGQSEDVRKLADGNASDNINLIDQYQMFKAPAPDSSESDDRGAEEPAPAPAPAPSSRKKERLRQAASPQRRSTAEYRAQAREDEMSPDELWDKIDLERKHRQKAYQ